MSMKSSLVILNWVIFLGVKAPSQPPPQGEEKERY